MAGPIHTQFAMKALDLADLFKAIVGSETLASTQGPTFSVELSAPDGPSTGGGAQSVQHIRLVREGMTVVAGSIDTVQKTAELRSFDYAGALHAQRWKGAMLPIERAAYDAMITRIRNFVTGQGLSVVLKDAAPVLQPSSSGGNTGLVVLLLLVVALVAGGAYYFTMFRR